MAMNGAMNGAKDPRRRQRSRSGKPGQRAQCHRQGWYAATKHVQAEQSRVRHVGVSARSSATVVML